MRHIAQKITMVATVVALLGASCTTHVAANANTAALGNLNMVVNTNILRQDIIYGTDMAADVVDQSRKDCEQKGGTFNQCGSACANGERCIAACALRCDF